MQKLYGPSPIPRVGLLIAVVLSTIRLGQAQGLVPSEEKFLLPMEVTISGVVVDSDGNPAGKVYIEHATGLNQKGPLMGRLWIMGFSTDDAGQFTIKTRSPYIVFVKWGFRSVRIRSEEQTSLRVRMEKLPKRFPPVCSTPVRCDSLGGRFCFPKISDEQTKPGYDVDYVARAYSFKVGDRQASIRHGSGPMWSLGRPFTQDVWSSIDYEEVVYKDPLILTDARGKTPDGKLWRYVGMVGESADYQGVDVAIAAKLDEFLDGMCVVPK